MKEIKDIKELPEDQQVKVNTLILRPVRMVIIYKPTNESTMRDVAIKDCRNFFEAAVKQMIVARPEARPEDFMAVQVDFEDKDVIVSSL